MSCAKKWVDIQENKRTLSERFRMQTHKGWGMTHDPQSVKLQDFVEFRDFLKPPRGRTVAEEVREGGVGSEQLGSTELQELRRVTDSQLAGM